MGDWVRKNKRGQITIFIIIAIIIVILGMVIYFLWPKTTSSITNLEENPKAYIQNCLEEDFQDNIQTLSIQGGSMEPKINIAFERDLINYLCYTNKLETSCINQQSLLEKHVVEELEKSIKDKIEFCFSELEEDYRDKGYSVNIEGVDSNVNLLPGEVILNIDKSVSLEMGTSKTYDNFSIVIDHPLYQFVQLALKMVGEETSIGKTDLYQLGLDNLEFRFEKFDLMDKTKIYRITEKESQNKFQFASRSMVLS